MDVEQFVLAHAPEPPARLLEVGCGTGDLARSLARHGFDVVAIDPEAPEGAIFQRTSLEDFTSSTPFDVVAASRSIHHIADIFEAVKKIQRLLKPRGLFVLNEFAWDQMDETTARWYLSQVDEPRHEDESLLPGRFPAAWIAEHDGLHDSDTMQRALDGRFERVEFNWIPYIAEHYLERPDLIEQEARLIHSGEIKPLGFRYIGRAKLN